LSNLSNLRKDNPEATALHQLAEFMPSREVAKAIAFNKSRTSEKLIFWKAATLPQLLYANQGK